MKRQKASRRWASRLTWLGIILISVWILGQLFCPENSFQAIQWSKYQNSRYGFEFSYPQDWIAQRSPDNLDGLAFNDPKKSTTEISGWGSNQLEGFSEVKLAENFITKQGIKGNLTIEINLEFTVMTLKINLNSINYYWQGKSRSQDFGKYYQIFDYIVKNYQILNQ